jgi:hypothetical protein
MKLSDLVSWKREDVGTWDALRCPRCGRVFHVGEDASIATWEQVMEAMSPGLAGFYSKIGFRDTRSGQHDSIKAIAEWPNPEARARVAEVLKKVREAVEQGARRRWTCANCQHSGIRYPKR